jgi:hypothetical protein
MSDRTEPTIHVARGARSIADGEWHTLECRRAGASLSILVDDQHMGSATVQAGHTVETAQPLSLGGKGPAWTTTSSTAASTTFGSVG